MSRITTTNFLADTDTQFQWATDDSDGFDRELDISFLARALERHTHGTGRGIPVAAGGIAANAVTATEIAAGAVGASELAAGAALANIGAGGIAGAYLAAGVALANIGAGTLTNTYLAAGAAAANLGFTPINKAGDVSVGSLSFGGGKQLTFANENSTKIDLAANTQYRIDVATGTFRVFTNRYFEFWNYAAGGPSLAYDTVANAMTINGNAVHHDGDGGVLRLYNAGGPVAQTQFLLGGGQIRFGNTGDGWDIRVFGTFSATGSKSRIATGHDGEEGTFHAFETPLPMFMEVGRSFMQAGRAVVDIPQDFANYVDLTDYHVILQPEGEASLYVESRTSRSFTVRTKGEGYGPVPFSWLVIARQGDMGHIERKLPLASV